METVHDSKLAKEWTKYILDGAPIILLFCQSISIVSYAPEFGGILNILL